MLLFISHCIAVCISFDQKSVEYSKQNRVITRSYGGQGFGYAVLSGQSSRKLSASFVQFRHGASPAAVNFGFLLNMKITLILYESCRA